MPGGQATGGQRAPQPASQRRVTPSGNNSILAQMQLGELAVRIRQFIRDRTARTSPAATYLCFLEFEPADGLDADAMLGTGDWIEDGLSALIDVAGHLQLRAALVDIHGKVDIGENGVVGNGEHRGKDGKHGGARPGVLAAHDAQDCIALRRARALIHYRKRLAISLVDGPRILEYSGEPQAIQSRLAMLALIDFG